MSLALSVAPTSEPILLDEAKRYLRVETDLDNARITSLLRSARECVERISGRQLITATYTLKLDHFPSWDWCGSYYDWGRIVLPRPPVQSVTSIAYTDSNGSPQTLATSVYGLDTSTEPGRIYLKHGQQWPTVRGDVDGIVITYVAGYTSAANVPEPFKEAMLVYIANRYENRGDDPKKEIAGTSDKLFIDTAIQSILAPVTVPLVA